MSHDLVSLRGVYSALYTPYDAEGRVNPEMIEKLVEFHLASGLRGFYVTGSTGESFLLTEAERKLVVETVVRANRGRGKVIAHVGHISTDIAVDLAKHAAQNGVDAISAVGPVYFGVGFEPAYRHYSHIAGATDLPFLIYSIGVDLVPEQDIRFFDIPNVVGMKYTGNDFFAMQQLRKKMDKPNIFLSGSDQLFLAALPFGVDGSIGTTQNMIPAHFARIHELFQSGKMAEARRLQEEANSVIYLMISTGDRSYYKAIMRYIGYDCGNFRLPYRQLTEEEYQAFAARLDELGVLERRG